MSEIGCFVCGTSLALFDEAAANFHLNTCLDRGGETGKSPMPDKAAADALPNKEIIAVGDQQNTQAQCPVCDRDLPQGDLQDHIDACLIAAQEPTKPQGAVSTNGQNTLFDPSATSCPCCLLEWTAIDVPIEDRELHVADCLSQAQALRDDDEDEEDNGTLSESRLTSVLSSFKANGMGKLRTARTGGGAHTSVTPHLIPVLHSMLERSASTRLAVLCTTRIEHIKSQLGDFGWGCGYKSACMVLSAVRHLEQYRHLFTKEDRSIMQTSMILDSKSPKRKAADGEEEQGLAALPTIADLQHIAEAAWAAGFDPEGKLHFKGQLVGSRRWIGTSEVYIMFTWLGIRSTIIDFPKVSGSSGAHTVLSRWVFDYFNARVDVSHEPKDIIGKLMGSNGSSVRICEDRMPLYLQHQGHSRVIVGVEQTKSGDMNLLVFDCGKKIASRMKEAAAKLPDRKHRKVSETARPSSTRTAESPPKLLEPYRVNLKSLSKKDEYQILRIETQGGALTPKEKLARRVITSLRVTE